MMPQFTSDFALYSFSALMGALAIAMTIHMQSRIRDLRDAYDKLEGSPRTLRPSNTHGISHRYPLLDIPDKDQYIFQPAARQTMFFSAPDYTQRDRARYRTIAQLQDSIEEFRELKDRIDDLDKHLEMSNGSALDALRYGRRYPRLRLRSTMRLVSPMEEHDAKDSDFPAYDGAHTRNDDRPSCTKRASPEEQIHYQMRVEPEVSDIIELLLRFVDRVEERDNDITERLEEDGSGSEHAAKQGLAYTDAVHVSRNIKHGEPDGSYEDSTRRTKRRPGCSNTMEHLDDDFHAEAFGTMNSKGKGKREQRSH